MGRLQKARHAKNESFLHWADSYRGSRSVLVALLLTLTFAKLTGKWVVDLGKMTAHSKGKSPCRTVRGLRADGTVVDAILSPTGKLQWWRLIISSNSFLQSKIALSMVYSDVRLHGLTGYQVTDIANTTYTWLSNASPTHCANSIISLISSYGVFWGWQLTIRRLACGLFHRSQTRSFVSIICKIRQSYPHLGI